MDLTGVTAHDDLIDQPVLRNGSCRSGARSLFGNGSACFSLCFLTPDNPCNGKAQSAGDNQKNRIKRIVVDRQISGNTRNAVSQCADSRECAEDRTDRTADHAGNEWLEEAQINTENRRLRDAESCGHGRRNRHGFCLGISDLETDRKAGAELGEVGSGSDRHPGIEADRSEHAGFNDVVHMVQAHDDRNRVERAHDAGTERVPDQNLRPLKDEGLKTGKDRSYDDKCEQRGNKYSSDRCDKEVDDLRHMLMQPFFNFAHKEHGDDDRDDMALIAHTRNRRKRIGADLEVAEQVPGRDDAVRDAEECVDCVRIACIPCI